MYTFYIFSKIRKKSNDYFFVHLYYGRVLYPFLSLGRQGIHQIELITNILGSPGPDVIKQSSSDVIRDMLSS